DGLGASRRRTRDIASLVRSLRRCARDGGSARSPISDGPLLVPVFGMAFAPMATWSFDFDSAEVAIGSLGAPGTELAPARRRRYLAMRRSRVELIVASDRFESASRATSGGTCTESGLAIH